MNDENKLDRGVEKHENLFWKALTVWEKSFYVTDCNPSAEDCYLGIGGGIVHS